MARKSYNPGDFNLIVKRSKTGLGLYAEDDIPKGACVIEYKGPQLSAEQEAKSRSKYLFEVNARKTIDGTVRSNTARYINHSCRPNCEPNIYKGRVFIHALRRIRPGEELNYDYGKNYFDAYLKDICRCPKCEPEKTAKKAKTAKATKKAKAVVAAKTKASAKTSRARA